MDFTQNGTEFNKDAKTCNYLLLGSPCPRHMENPYFKYIHVWNQ